MMNPVYQLNTKKEESMAGKNELELLIYNDVKEWAEVHMLDGEDWDDYFKKLSQDEFSKRMDEVMDKYWKDHIFPIDEYV